MKGHSGNGRNDKVALHSVCVIDARAIYAAELVEHTCVAGRAALMGPPEFGSGNMNAKVAFVIDVAPVIRNAARPSLLRHAMCGRATFDSSGGQPNNALHLVECAILAACPGNAAAIRAALPSSSSSSSKKTQRKRYELFAKYLARSN